MSGAGAEQRQTPYLDALCEYAAREPARLHVPGHKGGSGADPGLAEAIGERALRLPEAGVAILLDAGFEAAEAASAWRALWSYTFGFATFRPGSARAIRSAVAGLDEGSHPALTGAGDAFTDALVSDDEFASGLDGLLDGLALRCGLSRA